MVPAALGYLVGFRVLAGPARLREQRLALPALAGTISFVAYVVVLAALERAPAASVAAVRETSVVIAAGLAVPLLGDRVGASRFAGAVLVLGGVALLTL